MLAGYHGFGVYHVYYGLDVYSFARVVVVQAHHYAGVFLFRAELHYHPLARRNGVGQRGRHCVGEQAVERKWQQYVGKIHVLFRGLRYKVTIMARNCNAPEVLYSTCLCRAAVAAADKNSAKTGAEKRPFGVRKSENWFSARLPHMGAKKKYVPCILKYVRPIFCPLKTRLKMLMKMPTNADTALLFEKRCLVFAPPSTRNRHTGQEKMQARPCKGRA